MTYLCLILLLFYSSPVENLPHSIGSSEKVAKNKGVLFPSKVVGGEEAFRGEMPWIIDLRKPNHVCGASIINKDWIVTAAHCVTGSNNLELLFVAGSHNSQEEESSEQKTKAIKIVIYPGYNPISKENDMALVKVMHPFEFNERVQPVPLAATGLHPPEKCTVAGWGNLGEEEFPSSVLMKVDVPIVGNEHCHKLYGEIPFNIKESMLCAGSPGKDACFGDSGSPLMCSYGSNNFLMGIVSFGVGCGRPAFPGVYVDVSFFSEWINSILRMA